MMAKRIFLFAAFVVFEILLFCISFNNASATITDNTPPAIKELLIDKEAIQYINQIEYSKLSCKPDDLFFMECSFIAENKSQNALVVFPAIIVNDTENNFADIVPFGSYVHSYPAGFKIDPDEKKRVTLKLESSRKGIGIQYALLESKLDITTSQIKNGDGTKIDDRYEKGFFKNFEGLILNINQEEYLKNMEAHENYDEIINKKLISLSNNKYKDIISQIKYTYSATYRKLEMEVNLPDENLNIRELEFTLKLLDADGIVTEEQDLSMPLFASFDEPRKSVKRDFFIKGSYDSIKVTDKRITFDYGDNLYLKSNMSAKEVIKYLVYEKIQNTRQK